MICLHNPLLSLWKAALSGSLVLLVFSAADNAAQQVGTNVRGDDQFVPLITINSQLVVEAVDVRDVHGNFISNLTATDFHITEDGAAQVIKVFDLQHLGADVQPLPVLKREEEDVTIFNHLARIQLAPESREKRNYRDHRLLAFYFDFSSMMPSEQSNALGQAMRFVRTQMSAPDLVSVMRYDGAAVDVLQDFTGDRNRLLSILGTMLVGEGDGKTDLGSDQSSADSGAAFGQDDSEFNLFNNDRQLAALQTAARMLAQVSEKKSLVYFSSGLRLHGTDNIAQLHATVDEAVRAGVSFWPIDARGLVASAPLGDATQAAPGNLALYTGEAAHAVSNNLQRSQDTLYSLASETGGKALLDNNELSLGIVNAQHAITDYYILGYYTTNSALNGRFRKININLNGTHRATLDYRHGYYARKEFSSFNSADKERQLEEALLLDDPITDLTIAMEVDYFQLNRAEYYVPIIVKIPGRELARAKHFGAEHARIDFICEVKDETSGMTASNVRDYVDVKLSDATAAELAHRPIVYDSGFTLLPGRYSIKFLARDNETGRIGTYQTSFVIPNLNKEAEQVPLSSVVIGAERKTLQDVLYDTVKAKERAKEEAVNPLVVEGRKLIPSVTRVFHRNLPIYILAHAYAGAANSIASPIGATLPVEGTVVAPVKASMVAQITLTRKGRIAFSSKPIRQATIAGNRLGMVPIWIQLEIDRLEPGEYQCQLTVLDPANQRASFRTFPLLVLP